MTSLDVAKGKRISQARVTVRHSSALMVRVSDVQRRSIEQRAAHEGLSSSAWVRMIITRELRNKPETER